MSATAASTSSNPATSGNDRVEVIKENSGLPLELGGHSVHVPIHHQILTRGANPSGTVAVGVTSGGASSSVVQIRPMRTAYVTTPIVTPNNQLVKATNVSSTSNTLPTIVTGGGHPQSILVSRSGGPNLTILPRTATTPQSTTISALQFTRGGAGTAVLRPNSTIQATNATLTPISPNLGASIRLASGPTVNNGSWIQTTPGSPGISTLRPATIQVTRPALRPDVTGKIIHVPQPATVQHVTQLQVVDKGSILKPTTPISVRTLTATPIGSPSNNAGITLGSIGAFTIRPAAVQRSPATVITSSSQPSQKVITQPAHGPPIIVNASGNQKFTQIQNFSALPRIPVFSISAPNGGNTVITTNSSSTIIGMSPKSANAPNLIGINASASAIAQGGNTVTKVYPISRDVSTTLVESYINQGHVQVAPNQNHISSPTLTVVSNNTTGVTGSGQGTISNHRPTIVIASSTPNASSTLYASKSGTTCGSSTSIAHQLIQVHQAPLSLHSSSTSSASTLQNSPNFYVEQGKTVSIFSSNPTSTTIKSGTTTFVSSHSHPLILTSTTSSSVAGVNEVSSHQQSHPSSTLISEYSHPVPLANHKELHTSHSTSASALISTSITTSAPASGVTTTTSIVTVGNVVNNAIITTTTTSSTTISPPVTTSTTVGSGGAGCPSQSPKSNHSPRPSILRKREGPEALSLPLRAQRNLTINFTGMNNNGTGSSQQNLISSPSSVTLTSNITSNKENNGGGGTTTPTSSNPLFGTFTQNENSNNSADSSISGGGVVAIAKKDFLPPNEESSWQSCSSNSSSGSTTLSATSETAETQADEFSNVSGSVGGPPTNLSGLIIAASRTTNCIPPVTHQVTSSSLNVPQPIIPQQNGILVRARQPQATPLRTLPSSVAVVNPVRHRSAFAKGRDTKIRAKDLVGLRKKPRKQLLTKTDFTDASSSEISFYQGKRFKKSAAGKTSVTVTGNEVISVPAEGEVLLKEVTEDKEDGEDGHTKSPEEPRVEYYNTFRPYNLMARDYFRTPLKNHFNAHADVTCQDEKRPTIHELANQQNIQKKIGGWKLERLSQQIDKVIENEVSAAQQISTLLSEISSINNKALPYQPSYSVHPVNASPTSRDLSRIEDLLKGNLQRCKVIKDQLNESKTQTSKFLDHYPRVLEVINKHLHWSDQIMKVERDSNPKKKQSASQQSTSGTTATSTGRRKDVTNEHKSGKSLDKQ